MRIFSIAVFIYSVMLTGCTAEIPVARGLGKPWKLDFPKNVSVTAIRANAEGTIALILSKTGVDNTTSETTYYSVYSTSDKTDWKRLNWVSTPIRLTVLPGSLTPTYLYSDTDGGIRLNHMGKLTEFKPGVKIDLNNNSNNPFGIIRHNDYESSLFNTHGIYGPYSNIQGYLSLSDGSTVFTVKTGDKQFELRHDTNLIGTYKSCGLLSYHPAGGYSCLVESDEGPFLVTNGTINRLEDGTREIIFNENGQETAVNRYKDYQYWVYYGQVTNGPLSEVYSTIFWPGTNRLITSGIKEGRPVVMIDGIIVASPFTPDKYFGFQFSSDRRHILIDLIIDFFHRVVDDNGQIILSIPLHNEIDRMPYLYTGLASAESNFWYVVKNETGATLSSTQTNTETWKSIPFLQSDSSGNPTAVFQSSRPAEFYLFHKDSNYGPYTYIENVTVAPDGSTVTFEHGLKGHNPQVRFTTVIMDGKTIPGTTLYENGRPKGLLYYEEESRSILYRCSD